MIVGMGDCFYDAVGCSYSRSQSKRGLSMCLIAAVTNTELVMSWNSS